MRQKTDFGISKTTSIHKCKIENKNRKRIDCLSETIKNEMAVDKQKLKLFTRQNELGCHKCTEQMNKGTK